jgi:dTDP-4-dehydrorhamnose reductase
VNGVRIVVTGAGGQLGRQLVGLLSAAGQQVWGPVRSELDIADPSSLDLIAAWRPDVVINAAAWTDVDGCAREPDRAMDINGRAAGELAQAASRVGALSVQISTNEVFDGLADRPYAEADMPSPINPYGASKLAGEQLVAAANPEHLIVRTAWIFGPGGRNFPSRITEVARREADAGRAIRVVDDEIGNPTWAPDLARGIWQAIQLRVEQRGPVSILHLAGEPPTSRFHWAEKILSGSPGVRVTAIPSAEYPRPAPVPRRAVLSMELAHSMGIAPWDWEAATAEYVAELPAAMGS